MPNLEQILSQELSLRPAQIKNALELFAEGATVPFVARYRKERTGEMNEIQLRDLQDRYTYLTELRDRLNVRCLREKVNRLHHEPKSLSNRLKSPRKIELQGSVGQLDC